MTVNTTRPVLLCYDGSEDAKQAIAQAANVLGPREALVVTVWQDARALPGYAWAAPMAGIDTLLQATRDAAHEVAGEGVDIARAAGFSATPITVEASGSVWSAIVETAQDHDVALIVLGSRGLSGVKSILLGSVSSGVVHHATRPTLVVRRVDDPQA